GGGRCGASLPQTFCLRSGARPPPRGSEGVASATHPKKKEGVRSVPPSPFWRKPRSSPGFGGPRGGTVGGDAGAASGAPPHPEEGTTGGRHGQRGGAAGARAGQAPRGPAPPPQSATAARPLPCPRGNVADALRAAPPAGGRLPRRPPAPGNHGYA